MKKLLRILINMVYSLILLKFFFRDKLWGNIFRFSKLKYKSSNILNASKSSFVKSTIELKGINNKVKLNDVSLMNSSIYIDGKNNQIDIKGGTHINNKKIIIKGSNCSIKIGSNTVFYGGRIVNEGIGNKIEIGDNCLFSDQIEIWSSDTHPIFDKYYKQVNPDKPVRIGNNVWIGCRVNILKGVHIADGAVVGLGTVVTKDIPGSSISVGYPNKVIKENITWKREYLS